MKTIKKIIFFILLNPLFCNAQIITTIAGNGSHSHTGDGGPAAAASIGQPYGCAVDNFGNFYFTNAGGGSGCWVRKIDLCGTITTVAGTGDCDNSIDGGLATSSALNNPLSIAFDVNNNLYIGEEFSQRVRKVDAITGIISTVAGNGITGFSGDGGSATSATLNEPGIICLDKPGNLYIVDAGNGRIRKVDTSGIISTIAGNPVGPYSDTANGVSADSTWIADVYGICVDTIGNVFFGDDNTFTLRKVDTAGIISTVAGNGSYFGGDGGPAINAGLEFFGLEFDRSGNLYISGWHANNIRKINVSSIIYTVAGNDTAGFSGDAANADSAEINVPYGIALDSSGNLFIADCGNSRIRKVTFYPIDTPSVTITANTSDTICSGTSVTYAAAVTSSTTAFTYQWLVNGNSAGTDTTYTYTPVNGDSVRCILFVSGLCAIPSSNTIHIVADTITTPSITIAGPVSAAIGSAVTFTAIVTDGGSSYSIQWYNDGVLFATTTVPTVTYTKADSTDSITAQIIPSQYCYDSSLSVVAIVSFRDLGIANLTSQPIEIYPNPAHNEVTVTGNDMAGISISNTIGQTLISKNISEAKVSLDVSGLPPGIYLITVTDGAGRKTVSKVVKQ